MPDYDGGFKIVARHAGRQLTELAGVPCDEWEPLGDTMQTTERLADRAFRARHGPERFVVYLEAYTTWRPEAPWSVLVKSALLAEREKLPTVNLVFVLRRPDYKPQGGRLLLETSFGPSHQVWFREICLWEVEPGADWETHPGLMALYPLCRHTGRREEVVVRAARAITDHTGDRIIRADLLTTLAIFGKLAYPGLDLLHLIGREQMRESKFFEEVMAEGRVEGKLEEARTSVLEVLGVKYGSDAADEFRAAVGSIADLEQLRELRRLAIKSRRLTEFRRRLLAAASAR